jgi:hypothetical protein
VLTLAKGLDDKGEVEEGEEEHVEFLEAGEEAAEAFQPGEEPLDLIALLVESGVVLPWLDGVGLWGNDRAQAEHQLSGLIALIGAVHQPRKAFWHRPQIGKQGAALRSMVRVAPATERRLWPFEHPRQPDEPWGSIRRGTCRWPLARFFSVPSPIRMHLHRTGVKRERFDLDAHDLFHLQLLEDAVQNTVPRPPLHPHVDRVPPSQSLRKTTPLAPLLSHGQHRIQHLQVAQPYIPTLHRLCIPNPFLRLFPNLHLAPSLTEASHPRVNTLSVTSGDRGRGEGDNGINAVWLAHAAERIRQLRSALMSMPLVHDC